MCALQTARLTLGYLGKNKSEIKFYSKEFSKLFKSIVAGKPKNEKKAFYKLYQNFLKNPENSNIQNQLNQALDESSYVQRSISHITPHEGEISMEGIWAGLERAGSRFHLENQLVRPIKNSNVFNEARREFTQAIENIDFTSPLTKSIELSPEQIEQISKSAIRNAARENAIMTGRLFMYPINKAVSFTIPKNHRKLFGDVFMLPKSEFGAKYYERLVSSHAIEGRAPKCITVTNQSAKLTLNELLHGKAKYSCQGGFNPYFNTIEFTKEFSSLPKCLQANLITHEELHFQQIDVVIRTFGIERYIKALKTKTLNTLKLDSKYKNMSESEIEQLIDKSWAENNLEQKIKDAFINSSRAQKIEPTSEQGQQAKLYLDSIENYVSADKGLFFNPDKQYLKNTMEDAAYREGRRAGIKAFIMQNLNLQSL